ncbi:MAG TPA: tripartite tricarboxylate transporter substrate-binding protein, partial [Burkholderiales bacterium]|nr:tripartite tricarboxylate transporter substrate-binding protein [Burkholderiales bacterium]
ALIDTYSGQVDLFFSTLPAARPHLTAGKLRTFGVTTARRSAAFPDVPTIAESGVPGFEVTLWHGLIGPKGMTPVLIGRLNTELNTIIASPETAQKLAIDGVAPAGGTPAEFSTLIKSEIAQWRTVAVRAGVKPE